MSGRIIIGDCLDGLRDLPDGSVNCVVTSPPYFGLRDYGTGTWEGGDPDCDHVVGEMRRGLGLATSVASTRGGGHKIAETPDILAKKVCPKCGAVRVDQQVGLEPTPDDYVQKMVEIFREVRRVLRDDGTLWLNIGDSYASSGGHTAIGETSKRRNRSNISAQNANKGYAGDETIKTKELIGIPWMLAFALRADGWYLRQDNIWHKPNPMPESVRDRCTKAHEYVFMFSKGPRYFFDSEENKEEGVVKAGTRGAKGSADRAAQKGVNARPPEYKVYDGRRNRRSVWTVTTKPFKEAHFATFPPDLIDPCIRVGCPRGGVVLDPFFGAGTTGLVAQRHGRHWIGIELNPEYVEISRRRIEKEARFDLLAWLQTA